MTYLPSLKFNFKTICLSRRKSLLETAIKERGLTTFPHFYTYCHYDYCYYIVYILPRLRRKGWIPQIWLFKKSSIKVGGHRIPNTSFLFSWFTSFYGDLPFSFCLQGLFLATVLLANMFLSRKCVTSSPICPNGSENCQVSLGDLFDRAVKLSHYIHSLSAEIFNEFVSNFGIRKKLTMCSWTTTPGIPCYCQL